MIQKFTFSGLLLLFTLFLHGQSSTRLFNASVISGTDSSLQPFRPDFKPSGFSRNAPYGKMATALISEVQNTRKQKLDSSVFQTRDASTGQWVNGTKDLFLYDQKGYNTRRTELQWNKTTGQWVGETRNDYSFDSKGNQTQDIWYMWEAAVNNWVFGTKTESAYNAGNNITQMVFYNWDKPSGKWVSDQKDDYTYDTSGFMTQHIHYKRWDATLSQWILDYKETYTIDAKGNRTGYVLSQWSESGSQWINNSRTDYTFDGSGKLTLFTLFNWNTTTSQWVNGHKTEYNYDAGGNNVLNITQSWTVSTGLWTNGSRSEYQHDAAGNIIQLIYSTWNKTSNQWVLSTKYDYSYNGRKDLVRSVTNKWNAAGGQWIPDLEIKSVYDLTGNRTQLFMSRWNTGTGQWVINQRTDNLYDINIPFAILVIPEAYLFTFINDTVFSKVTSIVNYETDQTAPANRHVMYYSDFLVNNNDTVRASVCEGKNYTFNNKTYSQPGNYPDTLVSQSEYDRIVTVAIAAYPVYQPKTEVKGDTLKSVDTYLSYQWYNENGKITGAVSKTFVINKSGKYRLAVTDANGCTQSSSVVSVVYSAVDPIRTPDFNVSVFPNPGNGIFSVRMEKSTTTLMNFKLINQAGQVIDEREVQPDGVGQEEYFNIPFLQKGIYLLRITSGNVSATRKIVIR